MEVYIDDMVVKSQTVEEHVRNLEEIFHHVRKYNMPLNPEKCVFGEAARKFLEFMLTARGIEANPDNCAAFIDMRSPKSLKEMERLVGRLMFLVMFLLKLIERIKPILKIIQKQTTDKWDEQCEKAFQEIKAMIASPPIIVD